MSNGNNSTTWWLLVLAAGIIFGVGPFRKAKCTRDKPKPNIINTDYKSKQTTQPSGSNNNSRRSNSSSSSGSHNNNGGYVAPSINVQQPQKEWYNCGCCNGTGKCRNYACNGGRQMCHTCNGTGQNYNSYSGLYERCINSLCRGGYSTCATCNATGAM
jgi:hypothetical protein